MCLAGKARAASIGQALLLKQISLEDIEASARRADTDLKKGADTSKHHLIDLIVFRHAKSNDLSDFVNEQGHFLKSENEIIDTSTQGLPNRINRQVRTKFGI